MNPHHPKKGQKLPFRGILLPDDIESLSLLQGTLAERRIVTVLAGPRPCKHTAII